MPDLLGRWEMIAYPIGTSAQTLGFSEDVLAHFRRYQQTRFWHREAGGQLFARVDADQISIVEATGPRPTDRRSRTNYVPDPRAEQREIDERFPARLHFIGDWHTHPEDRPNPSPIDLNSTGEGVRRSRHNLYGFVMVIVGRIEFPDGLHVAIHDGDRSHVLGPLTAFPKVPTAARPDG